MVRKSKPRCPTCEKPLTYVYERLGQNEGLNKIGWQCRHCGNLYRLDQFEVKELTEKEKEQNRIIEGFLQGIIDGTVMYGYCPLESERRNERVFSIGDNCFSISVGQLIRVIEDRVRVKDPPIGIIWIKIPTSDGNHYFVAFETDYWEGLPDHSIYYFCGGMTDYSGEGGKAYRTMCKYIERFDDIPKTEITLNVDPFGESANQAIENYLIRRK